ncbi:hypothetical protein MATR_10540 [Marivirga tractuosa]|uniref:Uncharacterized protein n=1 Tax=Marivirga tractuosa (strain ATCC 23168 / DSM 4126 / NBRC 15989 / NCIMB 1408 / VKM B-1430 / H-43) TaxID=643867 RepID=E4TM41_MARTH|nr:hypothetical protein [Marivirga tractuosa]ADR21317.1 hypothetical protein Ftrac_1327 [Marivirga tractuosa DSM 4126]BDD14229.1 hypothetical protein MATR_10540 [Marivirga tractuosa]
MSSNDSDKDKGAYETPAWLKRVQEGSWEPEILISGIVLFGLFKIYPLIEEFNYFLEMNSASIFSDGTVNEALTAILKFANIILLIGFLSHILFRSVWAAFVGLSYIYKSGVKYEDLNYPDKYLRTIRKSGDYQQQIIKLEKICSVIFAISFLVFMWVAGLAVFVAIIAGAISIFQSVFPGNYDYTIFNNVLTIFLILVFTDFVSLGGLRKIPFINKVYYPIHRLAGWLTLAFLYRNIYYGVISNHKKWKVSLILFLFGLFTVVSVLFLRSDGFIFGRTIALAPYGANEYRLDESKYRSKVTDGFYSKRMHISDYVIDEEYLELFIVHTPEFEQERIMVACDYDNAKEKEGVSYDSLRMACLENFYGVALDGKLLQDDFIYQRNSLTGQDGLLTIVDVSKLNTGKHRLDLYYDMYYPEGDTTRHEIAEQIIFYKTKRLLK